MAVKELNDGRWICYYREAGKLKRAYFGRGAEGKARAEKFNNDLNLKNRRPAADSDGPTFGELAKVYASQKVFSENSRKMLLIRLKSIILPILGNKIAIRLNDSDIDDYINKRRRSKAKHSKEPIKFSTIKREFHDIKAILNWSVKRRPPLIVFNPVKDYPAPKSDDAVILPPTVEETEKIIAAANPHLTRAIYLSYYLGLRPGAVELLSLTWDQVNWESKTIRVLSAHKGGPVSRQVPIHDGLALVLKKWYVADGQRGPIIHYHGRAIKKIQNSWAGALKRAGISRRIRPYDLRHHFVTRALENGADMKALSEIVGSDPKTLIKHYQHVSGKMHRQTVAKIPSLIIQNITKNDKNRNEDKTTQHIEIKEYFGRLTQRESATLTR